MAEAARGGGGRAAQGGRGAQRAPRADEADRQKTEDPSEGWKIFSRIQQKFDRLHTKFDDLCTRAGLRSASRDETEEMHRSAAKIQAHKRGKNARRDARKAKASAGRGSPVARNALLDVGDSSGRASPDVPGERAAVM